MTIICPLASYTILVNWHKPYYRHTTLILLIDILQWVVAKQNILKNSLAVEKVCPVQNNQCKKLWNQRGWSRNDCDGIDWWQNFNNNSLGQFVLPCPSFTRNQQKKFFFLNFFPSTYIPSPPLLGHPFDFTTFFTLAILNRAELFLQLGCFLV